MASREPAFLLRSLEKTARRLIGHAMNADENYGFDVSGFLHLSQVLAPQEVEACTQAIDAVGRTEDMLDCPASRSAPFEALQEHPVLTRYLEALCGSGFLVDRPPRLVADAPEASAGAPLEVGPINDRRRLRYVRFADTRISKGVRMFLALKPTPEAGDVVLVPGSHTRT